MAKPRLLRSHADMWSAPPGAGRAWEEPPYSGFMTWLTRAAVTLMAISVTCLVVGLTLGRDRLVWTAALTIVPAFVYLGLAYAWARARAALDDVTYGTDDLADDSRADHGGRGTGGLPNVARPRSPTADQSDMKIVRRLLREVRPYWPHMFAVLLIYLLATPIFLLTPLPLKIAVDSVLRGGPLPGLLGDHLPDLLKSSELHLLVFVALLQVVVVLLGQVQSMGANLLRTYAGEKMVLGLRSRMFAHVQRLSLRFHDARGPSDSVYRIQYDAPAVQHITIDGLIPMLASAITLVSAVYVSARIDWQLSLVAMAVAPVLFMSSKRFKSRMRPHYRGVKNLESNAMGVVQEVLSAVRVVKVFGREDNEQARFVRTSQEGLRARIKLAFAEGVFGVIVSMTTAFGTAAVLFVGVRNVQTGVLSLGELLLVMGYIAQLYQPLKTMSKNFGKLQVSLASLQRNFDLLDHDLEVEEAANPLPLPHSVGEIEFKGVAFSYDDSTPVFQEASFHIDPGMRVGIAGRTGAGKSTLLSLLMRFYDPQSGAVLLDNHDIRNYGLRDLRDQFALVLQEPVLFSTSIGENIRYGRPDATFEEVVAAAKAANADGFIRASARGYETLVGERGMRLSGGERQRISLARAFLKNAPILVLDEPTSSVDVDTEAEIMDAMERLMEGRTSLIIAHRLRTLDVCDRILLVEKGKTRFTDRELVTNDDVEVPDLQADVGLKPARQDRAGRDLRPRHAVVPALAPRDLDRCVDEVARRLEGEDRLVAVRSRSAGTSGWYDSYRVTLDLSSGSTLDCYVKDFGSFERPKDDMEGRRRRELSFYRDIDPDGELGTPRYLGSCRDPAESRFMLLLEFVEGEPLGWSELPTWIEAAGWLGRLQSRVAPRMRELKRIGAFKSHDEAYFAAIADAALRSVGEYSLDLSRSLLGSVDVYLKASRILMDHPQTLVHGAFLPRQILVDQRLEPVRICPLDWENAALGSHLYDLAMLVDGLGEGSAGELFGRYLSEATWLTSPPSRTSELVTAVEVCRLHRTMKWLNHSHERGFPTEKVDSLVSAARRLTAEPAVMENLG